MFVFKPIAAIAITIKNLLKSLIGAVIVVGKLNTVVIIDAKTKKRIKYGKIFLRFTLLLFFSLSRVRLKARTRVIGMIASVLVSLTIVAWSNVLLPWIPSQAVAVAVTDEVSLTALPANNPKPSFERPRIPPNVGKINAAKILNRKITEIAWAISSSSASITGAVAAIAEPPQIDEPTPIYVAIFDGIFKSLHNT